MQAEAYCPETPSVTGRRGQHALGQSTVALRDATSLVLPRPLLANYLVSSATRPRNVYLGPVTPKVFLA